MKYFSCSKCQSTVVVTFLQPGDSTKCLRCGHEQTIPELLQEIAPSDLTERAAPATAGSPGCPVGEPSLRQGLLHVLTRFTWGVLLYVVQLTINLGPCALSTETIADILVLTAILRLKKLNLCTFWPTVGVVLCWLQLLGKAAALVGLSKYLYISFSPLVVAVILITLLQLIHRFSFLRGLQTLTWSALLNGVLSFVFIIGGLIGMAAVLAIHNWLLQFAPLAFLAGFMGVVAPAMILFFISAGLAMYALVDAAEIIKKQPNDALVSPP